MSCDNFAQIRATYKMELRDISVVVVVICCMLWHLTCATNITPLLDDCETLRTRCGYCERSLNLGPNENNLLAHVNRKCRRQVGRVYAWRPVQRCDIAYLRCKGGIDMKLTCDKIAELSHMQRRLS